MALHCTVMFIQRCINVPISVHPCNADTMLTKAGPCCIPIHIQELAGAILGMGWKWNFTPCCMCKFMPSLEGLPVLGQKISFTECVHSVDENFSSQNWQAVVELIILGNIDWNDENEGWFMVFFWHISDMCQKLMEREEMVLIVYLILIDVVASWSSL